jgi:phosphoribosylaminoimidazolecarboxamide formyltransferase/IMP cyclohydrolase
MKSLSLIKKALISVYHKDGLDSLLSVLSENACEFISTGGTASYIRDLGYHVTDVSELTGYPEILGGRVKTLHPAIFGGILFRRDHEMDLAEINKHEMAGIDLVVVDLYPFEETLQSGATESEIIEKIDIGGISLIRAAAKNHRFTAIVSDRKQYLKVRDWLKEQHGSLSAEQKKELAYEAFAKSSGYDSAIMNYFSGERPGEFLRIAGDQRLALRYGENPHQKGWFFGESEKFFKQLNGKEISYNNFLDIDAAFSYLSEFDGSTPAFVIIKHNNACGAAIHHDPVFAWRRALECDPLSAFGGVIICNSRIDEILAGEIDKIFFEVLIAPGYSAGAIQLLKKKSNRIILQSREYPKMDLNYRSCMGGFLVQEADYSTEMGNDFKTVSHSSPQASELSDLEFALKICKHSKSNTIILAKNGQLVGAGAGLTSRVDALKLAIERAKTFGLNTEGAVMASDAFFPFPDCVEIAASAGIKAVVQPGGSIKDKDSIEAANRLGMTMVFTGIRHFKH